MARMRIVPKVIDCISEEIALFELERNSSVVKERNDFINVGDMLFVCLAKYNDVVQISKCELSFDAW